ncbi:MAG: uroporphyrinogen-III synthase [Pseudomonadota bacterium]
MLLSNQCILVTRPEPQGHELCALLNKQGATTYYIPTLEIQPRAVHLSLFKPDIAIFISVNAVKHYPFKNFPASTCYFAVGVATAMALMERGVIAQQPEHSDSEGLLDLSDLQNVMGKSIAIFCGMGGRMLLQETLKKRGAHCQRYEVYERRCAINQAQRLQSLLKEVAFNYVICTSSENLLCLEQLAGDEITILQQIPLIVISKRIGLVATERGFTQVLAMKKSFDNISLVQQLVEWRKAI